MQHNRLAVLSALLVTWGALTAASAQAGLKGFKLEPMQETTKVEGVVRLTTKGSLEKLDLRVFSGDLKDGTTLLVSIVRAEYKSRIEVAKIEMMLGSALLQLDSRRSVSPVFPLNGLYEIYISAPGHGDLAHGVVPGGVRP